MNPPPAARKFDAGKPRADLLPPGPLLGAAEVLAYGAVKYGERNWEAGLDWSRCYGALLRHLFAWWGGEDLDPETGKSHLDHAHCCLLFLSEYRTTHPERDDRPERPPPGSLGGLARAPDAALGLGQGSEESAEIKELRDAIAQSMALRRQSAAARKNWSEAPERLINTAEPAKKDQFENLQ